MIFLKGNQDECMFRAKVRKPGNVYVRQINTFKYYINSLLFIFHSVEAYDRAEFPISP